MYNPLDLAKDEPDSRARCLLNDYLEQISGPLAYDLPYAERELIRAEIRGHVESIATAYIKLGDDPDLAMTAAIRQFGSPISIGKSLLDERTAGLRQTRLLCALGGLTGAAAGIVAGNLIGIYAVRTGLVSYSGLPFEYSWNGTVGFLTGWTVFIKRMDPLRSTLQGCKVFGLAMAITQVIVSALSSRLDFRFLAITTALFAMSGLGVGAVTGYARPWVERLLRSAAVMNLKA